MADAAGSIGLTSLPVADAPKADPAAARHPARAAEFKQHGVDIDSLSAKDTAEAFRLVKQYASLDVKALVERKAQELLSQRLENQRGGRSEDEEEEEEERGEKSRKPGGTPEQQLLVRLLEQVSKLEGAHVEETTSRENQAKVEEVKAVWAQDYTRVREQYPVLNDPDIEPAFRMLSLAQIFMAPDQDATTRPGYLQRLAPGILTVLAKADGRLAQYLNEAQDGVREGGPKPRANFDYENGSDQDFRAELEAAARAAAGRR